MIEEQVNHLRPLLYLGRCNICGSRRGFRLYSSNLREDLICLSCSSSNRKRQIAAAILQSERSDADSDLSHFNSVGDKFVWAMEVSQFATSAIGKNGVASEYFGSHFESGQIVNKCRHEDAMNPSFEVNSLDVVISSDVFEHIPEPYVAHQQIFDRLKPGGSHFFTVPYLESEEFDEIRATMGQDGTVTHHLPPEYHGDGLRPEGILVFRIFGAQMLTRLSEIGYEYCIYRVHDPSVGILGSNGLVFHAIKPLGESSSKSF
ncbi:class I SAM-dependent methyltransferase [Lacunimicrobium album]